MPHLWHPLLLSLLADTSKGGSREGRPLPSRGRSAATERRYVASRRRPGGVFRRDPWRGGGVWDIPLLPPPPPLSRNPCPSSPFQISKVTKKCWSCMADMTPIFVSHLFSLRGEGFQISSPSVHSHKALPALGHLR